MPTAMLLLGRRIDSDNPNNIMRKLVQAKAGLKCIFTAQRGSFTPYSFSFFTKFRNSQKFISSGFTDAWVKSVGVKFKWITESLADSL